jgi:hypothetical protein
VFFICNEADDIIFILIFSLKENRANIHTKCFKNSYGVFLVTFEVFRDTGLDEFQRCYNAKGV